MPAQLYALLTFVWQENCQTQTDAKLTDNKCNTHARKNIHPHTHTTRLLSLDIKRRVKKLRFYKDSVKIWYVVSILLLRHVYMWKDAFQCAHHTYKSSSCRDKTELINGFSALYYLTCPQQAFYYFHEFYMMCHLLWLYIGCEMTRCWKRPSHCVPILLAVISSQHYENKWSEMPHLQFLIFCHSSAYSPLMMQNDTKYAALGETYTDFITRYF